MGVSVAKKHSFIWFGKFTGWWSISANTTWAKITFNIEGSFSTMPLFLGWIDKYLKSNGVADLDLLHSYGATRSSLLLNKIFFSASCTKELTSLSWIKLEHSQVVESPTSSLLVTCSITYSASFQRENFYIFISSPPAGLREKWPSSWKKTSREK